MFQPHARHSEWVCIPYNQNNLLTIGRHVQTFFFGIVTNFDEQEYFRGFLRIPQIGQCRHICWMIFSCIFVLHLGTPIKMETCLKKHNRFRKYQVSFLICTSQLLITPTLSTLSDSFTLNMFEPITMLFWLFEIFLFYSMKTTKISSKEIFVVVYLH